MAETAALGPLAGATRALLAWTRESRVPVLIIGGVAVSVIGRPRTTKDVDGVAWLPDPEAWPAFLAAGQRHGILPRIPDAISFALRSRVLLLRHEASSVPIDLSLGALPFEENAVRRAVARDVGGILVPFPVAEDLIVMKAVAHRPVDAADIDGILRAHPDVDEAWVVSTVREFAEALEAPELVTDLVKLFRSRAPAKPGKKRPGRKRGA